MTDVMTPEQRSHCMSHIRGRNTKPEVVIRKRLWAKGLRYRLHSDLPGRPDIVFPGKKVAVFVDGCFWHRCPDHYQAPSNNSNFWKKKISGNVAHDVVVNHKLEEVGWRVLRFWEHEVRSDLERVVSMIVQAVRQGQSS
jgi:DNA mismatch endonuclease (patch repair protein)